MNQFTKTKVDSGRVAIHWLGQGGFAFKAHAGGVIFVDPYLSDSANSRGSAPRLVEIPIKARDVVLDYLFLTHDHVDHTDPHTAPMIAQVNPKARVVCPPSSARLLMRLGVPPDQIDTATPGHTLEYPHFTVHVTPAYHSEDSVGFVFEFHDEDADGASAVVYITGDTEYSDQLATAVEDFGPDVLIVPINGRWGNMTAAQAARLAAEIAPIEVIPMHYGMFAQNTADPAEFVALLAVEVGDGPSTTAIVMKHSGSHVYCPTVAFAGRKGSKRLRSERARKARRGHEHHDGVRGAGASGGHGR